MRIWVYFVSQYLKTAFGFLFFALSLYFILTYMEDSQHYFNKYKPSNSTIFFYYFWQAPSIAIQFLPFSVLISGIVTNWILAKHGEIAALRAAGLSMMKISIPLVSVGILFTAFHFTLSELILPESTTHYLKLRNVDIEKKKIDNVFTESQWLKAANTILHFHKYDEMKQELLKVEYFKGNYPKKLSEIVHAQSGYFDENIERWVLRNALVRHLDNINTSAVTEVKPLYVTNIDFAPPKILNRESESSQLSFWQLRRLIAEAEIAGTNISDRVIDLYMKISTPFANLLFLFLTLPFALKKERQEETYIGIVICLVAALIYWFGNMALRSFALKGELNPFLAAWTMNVLVATLSYMLIRKLDKGQ
ncbi:LptF/LptG family permease [Fluviispira sanaruensis]|uniref:LPS export ABC transporter permease LptG n=1 Tax=Fluviispira sanaruensis TaxID=2493639 RepID=A0A4P2VVD2_FLUSA|nr:LptF/LptG family permease [Fluviispira sanaruensis]BBH52862.1 LPS export ABC transporter permease LptG [Fluviispira sanaruensis]